MATSPDYGAFMDKFILPPNPLPGLPLQSLSFAVKDMFDMQGRVSSFGNPDWKRTHSAATSTAPAIMALLKAGATCVGTLIMDEMAYSIMGENIHYGTPTNPCAADRVPGGSSSGSAVAAGAKLADFTIGTDCIGSSRVPASYCGTFGIRTSHGLISITGVIPMAQSLDTVGDVLEHMILGDYVMDNVPGLKDLLTKRKLLDIPSLSGLSKAMQLIERYEFKSNHAEWITTVKPNFDPGIKESVEEALRTTGEHIEICHSIKSELRSAITELLGESGVLVFHTVPGPPPKLETSQSKLEDFNARAFSLLSIGGLSGCSQVSMPLGMYNDLPISLSFVAKHRADGFLISLVENVYDNIKEKDIALTSA